MGNSLCLRVAHFLEWVASQWLFLPDSCNSNQAVCVWCWSKSYPDKIQYILVWEDLVPDPPQWAHPFVPFSGPAWVPVFTLQDQSKKNVLPMQALTFSFWVPSSLSPFSPASSGPSCGASSRVTCRHLGSTRGGKGNRKLILWVRGTKELTVEEELGLTRLTDIGLRAYGPLDDQGHQLLQYWAYVPECCKLQEY